MAPRDADRAFGAAVAEGYERDLVPLLFEPYAALTADRVAALAPRCVLEVAAGTGVLTRALCARLPKSVEIIATDLNPAMLERAQAVGTPRPVRWQQADALALPFDDGAVDVVTCSQVLHHFAEDEAVRVLRELTRVARVGVVIGDLRRSWLAAALFWLASWPLGFHRVTRHDGVLSVLRGFTRDELRTLAERAGASAPAVRRSLGWRLAATWGPTGAGAVRRT